MIIIIITIIAIIIIIIVVVVVVVHDDTYYWVYLSSDHTFQVYYKVRQVLLQNVTGITKCDDYNTKCDRTKHLSQPLLNGKRLFINENEFSRVLVSRALIFLMVNKILTASPWTTPMDYPYGQPLKWTSYAAGV